MPRKKTTDYDNTSITTLKGADRVRKRPAVIFGSDGIDGCQHSVFEILSNSIDEAREGYGKKITVTRYSDGSIEVEDHGRGIPVDYNENEKRYNWELVFCELYAGGKYNNNEGESYEFSLGMNGLGLVQPSTAPSIWMLISAVTATDILSVLKKARLSASSKKSRTAKRIRVQKFIGNPTSKSLRISTFSPNIFLT